MKRTLKRELDDHEIAGGKLNAVAILCDSYRRFSRLSYAIWLSSIHMRIAHRLKTSVQVRESVNKGLTRMLT